MNGFDLAYGAGLLASAPFWLLLPRARRKVLSALSQRMGRGIDTSKRDLSRPAVLIHAVSLGEINATRTLIQQLSQRQPDLQYIVTTTTQTGYDRGCQLYGTMADVTLIRYPLDFTSAVARVLDALKPAVAVLIELELWPNFLRQCRLRKIPALLINGRITPGSFRGYRRARLITRPMFGALAVLCAQDQRFAEQFIALGADPRQVHITGTMKFDTATLAEGIDGDANLAAAVGLDPAREPVWVCGSTGPGEEAIVLEVYKHLLQSNPSLRLAIIPRHPERFDEVAQLIEQNGLQCLRRSAPNAPPAADSALRPVVLGDTMGELRKFYSLATVVFVGRSLVDLGHRQHGSDMIEPAALGKAVLVGPFTQNFADAMLKFRAASAVLEVATADALGREVARLLDDPAARQALGGRAQEVVRAEQGATARHVEMILRYLPG